MRPGWVHAWHVRIGKACDWKNNCLTTVEILSFLPTNILFKRVEVDKISKTIVMNYFIRAWRFISVKYLGKIPAPSKILHSLLCQNVVIQPCGSRRWQAGKIRRMHMPCVDMHASCWENTWQVSGRHVGHFFTPGKPCPEPQMLNGMRKRRSGFHEWQNEHTFQCVNSNIGLLNDPGI